MPSVGKTGSWFSTSRLLDFSYTETDPPPSVRRGSRVRIRRHPKISQNVHSSLPSEDQRASFLQQTPSITRCPSLRQPSCSRLLFFLHPFDYWNVRFLEAVQPSLLGRSGFRHPSSSIFVPRLHVESRIINTIPSGTSFSFIAGHWVSERKPVTFLVSGPDSRDPDITVDVGKYSELCFQLHVLAAVTQPDDIPTSKPLLSSIVRSDVYPSISAANNEHRKFIPDPRQQREWPFHGFYIDRRPWQPGEVIWQYGAGGNIGSDRESVVDPPDAR